MATIEFECPVQRVEDDNRPTYFGWPRESATFTYTYSIDGGETFSTGLSTITELTADGIPGEYKIPFSSAERPSSSGTVVYKVTDGTDTGKLYVNVSAKVTTPTADPDFTDYGPKRVKTKEMEIEQFDPLVAQKASERSTVTLPVFSDCPEEIAFPRRTRTQHPDV